MKALLMKSGMPCLAKLLSAITLFGGLLLPNGLHAQFFVHGDVLTIQPGARLVIKDSLRVKKNGNIDAKIQNNGKMVLGGDMKMQPGTQISGNGNFCFAGSAYQTLQLNGIPLPRLEVLNGDSLVLGDDLTISDSLILGDGHLILGNNDLVVDSTVVLSGGSSTSYIRVNGTGRVKATVGSSPVTIPVGRNPYLPVIIDNGGGAEFSVGVADRVYQNPETQTTEETSNVVSETWTVQASQSVNNVTVQIGWDASEETSGFNRSLSNLAYWENGVSNSWDQGTIQNASGSGPYTLTRSVNFTSNPFYFGIGSSGSALPVELSYFNVEWAQSGAKARLTWETAIEQNNSHFEIERSHNGSAFETIGTIEGQGTKMSSTNYQFIDHGLSVIRQQRLTVVYYRLKQIDYSGEFEYSPVRVLQIETETPNFSVYPNPVRGNGILHISLKGTYIVYSSLGNPVLAGSETSVLNVSTLASGTYFLRSKQGSSLKFAIQ